MCLLCRHADGLSAMGSHGAWWGTRQARLTIALIRELRDIRDIADASIAKQELELRRLIRKRCRVPSSSSPHEEQEAIYKFGRSEERTLIHTLLSRSSAYSGLNQILLTDPAPVTSLGPFSYTIKSLKRAIANPRIMSSFDDQGIPVVNLSNDGWSTEAEATATCFCGAVQLILVCQPMLYLLGISKTSLSFSSLLFKPSFRFPKLTIVSSHSKSPA